MRTYAPHHRSVRALQEVTGQDLTDPRSFFPGSAIELTLADETAGTWAGQLMVSATTNQLLRLDGILHDLFVPLTSDPQTRPHTLLAGPSVQRGLAQLARDIGGRTTLHLEPAPKHRDVVRVSLGPAPETFDVRVEANDWAAYVNHSSSFRPAERLPFGTLIASSLATAEAFKHLLVRNYGSKLNGHLQLARQTALSSYDYTAGGQAPEASPGVVDIGRACLAGLGGGGSAVIYALCATPLLRGHIAGVDPGNLDPSNGNRYLYATRADLDRRRPKTEAAADFHARLGGASAFSPHPVAVEDYLSEEAAKPEFVFGMVDDVPSRRGLQRVYRGPIVDAGVADFGYSILRVYHGEGMCLGCKHPFLGDEDIAPTAGLWGVTTDEARRLIRENPNVTDELLASLARVHGRDPHAFARLRGLPFRDARVDLECGAWAQDLQPGYAPSLPFLTALPGFLAAAELVKSRIAPTAQLRNVFHHNMLWIPKRGAVNFERPRRTCSVRCVP